MAEKSTFIKLDRNIQNWRWYQDANTFRIFVHILMNANIETYDFMNTTIHRGELATSYAKLGEALNLTISQVRTAISHLKTTKEIAVKQHSKFIVISVLNYAKYQDKTTGNSQSINIQITPTQQSDSSHFATIKESKERKECKEVEEVVVPTTTTKNEIDDDFLLAYCGLESFDDEDAEYDKLRELKGKYQGLVMSDRQFDNLLEIIDDITVFDNYCQKLINFIKEKGATNIKSHYATLLKWYKQDTETK